MNCIRFSLRTLLVFAGVLAVALVPLCSQLRSNAALANLQNNGANPLYIRTCDGISTPYLGSTEPFDSWHENLLAMFLGRSAVDDLELIVFTGSQFDANGFRDTLPDLRLIRGVQRVQLVDTPVTRSEAMAILAKNGLSRISVD